MRIYGVVAVVFTVGLVAAGCGWSPPPASPTTSVACGPADGPAAADVDAAIAALPDAPWRETSRGHTADCSLHWIVTTAGEVSDSPQQVLFFDGATPLGAPTPEPRPYITVTASGDDTAVVQYQWRQGDEPACCPTGIGTARFTVEDGQLTALDSIPNT